MIAEQQTAERTADEGRRAESSPQPRYTLLAPASYENIVGGAPPSPFVSTLLALGLIVIVAAAVATPFGLDTGDWWVVGGLMAASALFLASFVSRTG